MSDTFHCHAPGCGSGKKKAREWQGGFPFCPAHKRLLQDAGTVTFGQRGLPGRTVKLVAALDAAVPRGEIWTQLVRSAQEWLAAKDPNIARQQSLFPAEK